MTDRTSRRAFLGALTTVPLIGAPAAAVGAGSLAAVPPPRPDAELIRLLRQLLESFETERIAERFFDATRSSDDGYLLDAAYDATGRIVDAIERQRATSVAGLAVKALAVSWCSGDPGKPYPASVLPDQCQNVRLAFSIVDDLLAMRKGGA